MKKARTILLFLLPAIPLLTVFVPLVLSTESISFGAVICGVAFGEVSISRIAMMQFIYAWLPLFFFQVIYGTVIYEHYTSASVYYFTRCKSRLRWYGKETAGLFGVSFFYAFLILGYIGAAGLISGKMFFDSASFWMAFYFLFIYGLWLFVMTLLINVLAILVGSMGSFLLVGGFQTVCIALYGILEQWLNVSILANMLRLKEQGELEELSEMERMYGTLEQLKLEAAPKILVLKSIPFSNLVLKWHTSASPRLDILMHDLGIEYSYDLNLSAAILTGLSVLAFFAGYWIVSRAEFMENEREA